MKWLWRDLSGYQRVVGVLLVLFVLMNVAYLHRVPGLMGDESSEGENVYELLTREGITVTGERSYIGPAIDYVRVPFIGVLGYSALALRLPILVFSILTFILAAAVFRQHFGEEAALLALAAAFFTPIYWTFQRLGWTISLFPFFALLLLWLLTVSRLSQRPLLVGLTVGLGLHNHILFLPTLVGVGAGWVIKVFALRLAALTQGHSNPLRKVWFTMSDALKRGVEWWPALIGFAAGFSSQLVVLVLFKEDQGDPSEVATLFADRLVELWTALPVFLSGSSYIARYTGVELAPLTIQLTTGALAVLVIVGLVLSKKRLVIALWLIGLVGQLLAITYFIDRFSLRYLLIFSLGIWVLAGVGLGEIGKKTLKRWSRAQAVGSVAVAVMLSLVTIMLVLVPFLRTGGSTGAVPLGTRNDSATALLATESLTGCVRGAGQVYSENVHIYNRLLFLSHEYEDIVVVPENESKRDVQWVVHYRLPDDGVGDNERCPELTFWRVVPGQGRK